MIRRRKFISLLGGAAVAWPIAARAQQPTMPVIGYLNPRGKTGDAPFVAGFQRGLAEKGFVDRQNIAIEYRWAENQFDRLPDMAADLVRRSVNVIVAISPIAAIPAKAATATIPILFTVGADPVQLGLVSSLSRPTGNLTGVNTYGSELGTKGLSLVRDLVPNAGTIAVLVNPKNPITRFTINDAQKAAQTMGQAIHILQASSDSEIEAAFAGLPPGVGALLIGNDVFFNGRFDQLAALAVRHSLAAAGVRREFAAAGGVLSYGPSLTESYRELGVYAGRILQGARPADLPVLQPTRFELVINLKTAKALGLTVPPSLLAIADEVIE
jgi:putative tryptophan/tyrosine transport system substrate-binding protein